MRLKRISGAEEAMLKSNYVVKKPEQHRGKFKDLFDNDFPIHLEIGTGKGNFIIEKAKRNSNINYIGIEKHASVLLRALEKLKDVQLDNLLFINMDAKDIETILDLEVQTLYLNFSDPWPKNRHEHRRLTNGEFLSRYNTIFVSNAHIVMKTDNRKLFEYSLKSLTDNDFKISTISLDLHKDNDPNNIMTEYEEKFSSKGDNIYMVEVEKNDV